MSSGAGRDVSIQRCHVPAYNRSTETCLRSAGIFWKAAWPGAQRTPSEWPSPDRWLRSRLSARLPQASRFCGKPGTRGQRKPNPELLASSQWARERGQCAATPRGQLPQVGKRVAFSILLRPPRRAASSFARARHGCAGRGSGSPSRIRCENAGSRSAAFALALMWLNVRSSLKGRRVSTMCRSYKSRSA